MAKRRRTDTPATIAESYDLGLAESTGAEAVVETLLERLADLELAVEDRGWVQLLGDNSTYDFSREGLRAINRNMRNSALGNPLINRAVTLQASYVFGQGVSIKTECEPVAGVLQAFLDNPKNKAELTSQQAMVEKETLLQVEGNLFFVFFEKPSSGELVIRSIPFDEIADIWFNPEDRKDPWYYLRRWQQPKMTDQGAILQEQREEWYPDWRHVPEDGAELPTTFGGKKVNAERVAHIKVGQLGNMKFGLSEMYTAVPWARAYGDFLRDWSSIVRAIQQFAYKLSTKGGSAGVAAAKAQLARSPIDPSSPNIRNRPVAGSTFIQAEGTDLTPMPKTGANVSADDARRLLLMVCAGVGLPETFFGDVSVGTLATAKSLDRPTELKFRDRQSLWTGFFQELALYVISRAVYADPESYGAEVVTGDDGSKTFIVTATDDNGITEVVEPTIDVDFPPLLEHDVTAAVGAIVTAATLNGSDIKSGWSEEFIAELLLRALGQDDIDAILEILFPKAEDGITPKLRPDQEAKAAAAPPMTPPPPGLPDPAETMAEAARVIADAAEALRLV